MKARKTEENLPLERGKKKARGEKQKILQESLGSKLIKGKHIAKSTQLICISMHIRS